MKKTIFGVAILAAIAATAIVSCSKDKSAEQTTEPEYNAYEVDVEAAAVDTVVQGNDTTIQAQTVDQVTPESVQ